MNTTNDNNPYNQPEKQSKKLKGNSFVKKGVVFLFLLAISSLALNRVKSLRGERNLLSEVAADDIQSKWGKKVFGANMYLFVPYEEKKITELWNDSKKVAPKIEYLKKYAAVFAKSIDKNIQLRSEYRYRGQYKIPVFESDYTLTGTFTGFIEELEKHPDSSISLKKDKAYLFVTTSKPNSIINFKAKLNGKVQEKVLWNSNGVDGYRIPIDLGNRELHNIKFSIEYSTRGTEGVQTKALAEKTTVRMSGNWPSPSFSGFSLPKERKIDKNSFQSVWELSNPIKKTIYWDTADSHEQSAYSKAHKRNLGVSLFVENNIYLKIERSLKYGFLFIILMFSAIFLLESLGGYKLHPIQYLFISFCMVLFYLLLLGLSEKVGFFVSYGISSLAVVGVIHGYLSAIVKNTKRVSLCSFALLVLYSYMLVALESSDSALLIAAVCLFLTLAFIMFVTRKIDWHKEFLIEG